MSRIESISFKDIPCLRLTASSGASAVLSCFGAQVLSWRTADAREQLFLSERARFDGNVPIRGGIPVCFPQFAGLGVLPKHGLVRSRDWKLGELCCDGDSAQACLDIAADATTLALWPHPFEARLQVKVEANRLDVGVHIHNCGDMPLAFTAALHSYLAVDEVHAARLQGLQGVAYRDAANGDALGVETAPCLEFTQEVDRVFHAVEQPLLLSDARRRLGVAMEGFRDVVVWNPWAQRSAAFADLAPEDYRRMLCVEAALVQQPLTLAAAARWQGWQRFTAMQA